MDTISTGPSTDPHQCPIIERLTCSLMMNGRNNGKKLKAVRIIAHSFEIVCCQHAGQCAHAENCRFTS
jgi:ribosomal protein S7